MRISWLSIFSLILALPAWAQTNHYVFYKNPTHHYRITFPNEWIINTIGPNKNHDFVVAGIKDKSVSVSINIKNLPRGAKGISLDGFSEKQLQELKTLTLSAYKKKPFLDAKISNWNTTFVDNEKAIVFTAVFTRKVALKSLKVKSLVFQVTYKGKMYTITCAAPFNTYNQHENTFLSSVQSFIFTDKWGLEKKHKSDLSYLEPNTNSSSSLPSILEAGKAAIAPAVGLGVLALIASIATVVFKKIFSFFKTDINNSQDEN